MIKSFGCSFFYGSELSDCPGDSIVNPSHLTWPALVAQFKNTNYCCYAMPGNGNLYILNKILEQSASDDLFLINWSWIDRYDYIESQTEIWRALRPGEDTDIEKFYFRKLHSQYVDVLTNLGYIKLAIDYLNSQHIKFVMTYMDYLLFEPVTPSWHRPEPIKYLQDSVKPYLTNFNGVNFLDWSRSNNYKIGKYSHPLEQAHSAAAQYMIDQGLV